MEKLLNVLEEKVQTKKDLTLYMQEVSSLKEEAHNQDDRPLIEKVSDGMRKEFEDLLSRFKNKKEDLVQKREELNQKKEELTQKELNLRNKKNQLEERLSEASPEERGDLQNRRRELEVERRNTEEEVWKLEDDLNELEKEIYEAENGEGAHIRNPEKQLEVLEAIQNRLEQLPEIKLTLAYDPDKGQLAEIKSWLKERIGASPVLDLTIDSDLVGGAIVEFRGRWGDFSLRKAMEEIDYRDIEQHD